MFNIAERIGLSSLIDNGSLMKWEFMAGGMMQIIPRYKAGELKLIKVRNNKILLSAIKFFESALNGIRINEESDSSIPSDILTASKTIEICNYVFMSDLVFFQIKKYKTIKEKLNDYRVIIDSIQGKKKKYQDNGKKLDELWLFFQKLAIICRAKTITSLFFSEDDD
ncbi:MAG: hypothetical protein ABIG60_02500 [Patescibacteria group bacterium]